MAASDWLRGRPDSALTSFRYDPTLPDRDLTEVLATARAEWEDDSDEWQPHVCALAARGSREVLDAMVELGANAEPAMRELAAYVLGQLGPARPRAAGRGGGGAARDGRARAGPERAGRDRLRVRPPGRAARPRLAARAALASDDGVREAVAFALGGRPGEDTLEALIALSADAEPAVRDWATFALGTLAEQDSPALRDALAARLDDADEDTRLEAIHGLALRGDARAPTLRHAT